MWHTHSKSIVLPCFLVRREIFSCVFTGTTTAGMCVRAFFSQQNRVLSYFLSTAPGLKTRSWYRVCVYPSGFSVTKRHTSVIPTPHRSHLSHSLVHKFTIPPFSFESTTNLFQTSLWSWLECKWPDSDHSFPLRVCLKKTERLVWVNFFIRISLSGQQPHDDQTWLARPTYLNQRH